MTIRIGLALSGGGAKGIAHIGVLKVLEETHIPVHMLAGTSWAELWLQYTPLAVRRVRSSSLPVHCACSTPPSATAPVWVSWAEIRWPVFCGRLWGAI